MKIAEISDVRTEVVRVTAAPHGHPRYLHACQQVSACRWACGVCVKGEVEPKVGARCARCRARVVRVLSQHTGFSESVFKRG